MRLTQRYDIGARCPYRQKASEHEDHESTRNTWRGTFEDGGFALYYFHQGKMVGVLAAGRPDEERKPMQALVKARPAHEDVSAKLRDEGVGLDTL